ncbi:hypothetical protein WMY93_028841 [Mugilogobius chulae]|uniref:Uncharacterized protein n=1 Tax=Mugilogobius chulae TaxID=88201 RepID=A0AAW0MPI8_9GOBI
MDVLQLLTEVLSVLLCLIQAAAYRETEREKRKKVKEEGDHESERVDRGKKTEEQEERKRERKRERETRTRDQSRDRKSRRSYCICPSTLPGCSGVCEAVVSPSSACNRDSSLTD